ncbi:protein kinase domain-containing protein [Dactylosporangium sp. CA-092794]|uniref:serine/threonine-protein kinase n=1 Tax=Dactylosporangium sp. CA-092794 TaxID=3239929 RepID=UPI003D90EC84
MSVTLVGRYRLESAVGAGGMGTVWRATDLRLERQVAVKEVRFPASLSDEERAELTDRAMREARSAAKLDHPNIVAVHDVVVDDGRPWIIMRLIEGRSLDQVIRADGPLEPAEAARIGLALTEALSAAHAAGIVHRDVKPSNVLVQPDGKILLTDFSIAAAFGTGTLTRTGILLGSPGYIAPERLRTGKAGPEADYFSLGATLFFAVEARNPFEVSGDALAGMFAAATEPHPRPERAGALTAAIDGLLAKDPGARLTGEAARASLLAVVKFGETEVVPQTLRESAPPLPVFTPGRVAAVGSEVAEAVASPALAPAAAAPAAVAPAAVAPAHSSTPAPQPDTPPVHDQTPDAAPTAPVAGHDRTPDQGPPADSGPPPDAPAGGGSPAEPGADADAGAGATVQLDPGATVPQDPGSPFDDRPGPPRWSRRAAALVGSGVLALLIVIGILGRGAGDPPKIAEEPAAPTTAASSSPAGSPSPQDSPSDTAPPATEVAAPAPTEAPVVVDRPVDNTTTKPASRPKTTTAAAQPPPPPPPAPAATGASLSLSSTTYTGYCGPTSTRVTMSVTIRVNVTSATAVRFEMHSTDGYNNGGYSGTANGGSYSTSFAVDVGIASQPATTDFWFVVTAPGQRTSNRVTFHNNCY